MWLDFSHLLGLQKPHRMTSIHQLLLSNDIGEGRRRPWRRYGSIAWGRLCCHPYKQLAIVSIKGGKIPRPFFNWLTKRYGAATISGTLKLIEKSVVFQMSAEVFGIAHCVQIHLFVSPYCMAKLYPTQNWMRHSFHQNFLTNSLVLSNPVLFACENGNSTSF